MPQPLRLAGILAGIVAGVPVVQRITEQAQWPAPGFWAWVLLLGALLSLFWWQSSGACESYPTRLRTFLLALTSLISLVLVVLERSGLSGVFPVLATTLVGATLAPARANLWALVQGLALLPAFVVGGFSTIDAVVLTLVFGGLQLFVLSTMRVMVSERAARQALQEAHRELQSARTQMEAQARDNERLQIARELHDVMGHHLAALSLTLEAASCGQQTEVASHVAEGQVLTKRLLRDVRRVVSVLRSRPVESLEEGLRRLADEVRQPRIHLALDMGGGEIDPGPAQAILRCAQEIATNAVRHSGAENLNIVVRRTSERWCLEARDDGRGGGPAVAGHGLVGMRERVHELGGDVVWESSPDHGFSIRFWIPVSVETVS